MDKYLTGSFFGEDRNGHPVFYDFLGNVDTKGKRNITNNVYNQITIINVIPGLYRSCKGEDTIRYKIMQGEQGNMLLKEQSKKVILKMFCILLFRYYCVIFIIARSLY